MDKKVKEIPATIDWRLKMDRRVGIYCRVSSSRKKQLQSLAAQASGLTRFVAERPYWKLIDIFMDVAPGSVSKRDGYQRMLDAARQGLINLVIVKSSSRLGRDTVEVIQACRELAHFDCDIYFQNANSYYSEMGPLIAELTAGTDQADNESRSENIRWGIRRGMEDGTSTVYDRVCYGYEHDEEGQLVIKEDEATVVRKIFLLYLSGASILKIKRVLEEEGVPAPKGGPTWAKKTIDNILTNNKYIGESIAHTYTVSKQDEIDGFVMTDEKGKRYLAWASHNNHPAIIATEAFYKVQQMRTDRSNVVYNPDGTKTRKSTHYSSKRTPSSD